ncbi:hypothetical protein BDR26DRAFT_858236 [Obelidium mucronatum]|nr:hypothetical protein BDR26DRAFT_858236 [Obelidium mucronatum]
MLEKVQILNELRTGVTACRIMNMIQPGMISRIADGGPVTPMTSLENLASFSADAPPPPPLPNLLSPVNTQFPNTSFSDSAEPTTPRTHTTPVAATTATLTPSSPTQDNENPAATPPQQQPHHLLLPQILSKLDSVDTNLTTTLKTTVELLNKVQAEKHALAQEIFQHLETLSKRLTNMETVQKGIVNHVHEVGRRSHLNGGGGGLGSHVRSSSELSNDSGTDDGGSGVGGQRSGAGSPPATPKLFPKLPVEVMNSGLPKQELMRLSVVYELIETEADYVRDLGIMINFHQEELLASKFLDEITISTIFSNVEDLISANNGLLAKLNAKREENPIIEQIADVFLESNDIWVEAYTVYCSNYPLAMKIVTKLMADDKFKQLMQQLTTSPTSRGLSLESFLIKPVQRICKYPLLLRELLKHTVKTSIDYPELEKALENMESLAAKVNEATQALEKKERLASLLSRIESPVPLPYHEKKLVMEGMTQMNKSKERHLTMFKDVLIVSKVVAKGKYTLETLYNMHELVLVKCNVHDALLQRSSKTTVYLQYTIEKRDITFTFEENVFGRWNEAFKSCINDPENVLKRRIEPSSPNGNLSDSSPSMREIGKTNSGVFKKAMIPNAFGLRGTSPTAAGIKSFTSSDSQQEMSQSSSSRSEIDIFLPEIVEINGAIWKKTLSAKNMPYYYNPATLETMWNLPREYLAVQAAEDNSKRRRHLSGERWLADQQQQQSTSSLQQTGSAVSESEADTEIEAVEGFADWRHVKSVYHHQHPYYFNIATQETSWEPPRK